jgi:NAD(P)-dependent dehydrogenase (short-subunit alcohol dehydrogenase family)
MIIATKIRGLDNLFSNAGIEYHTRMQSMTEKNPEPDESGTFQFLF